MKILLAAVLTIITLGNLHAEVYERYDRKNECTLYYSTFSKFFKEGTNDRRASISPGLNFEKFEGIYSLKGLWSMFPLVRDVEIGPNVKYLMTHEFTHACITDERKIKYISKSRRKLMNDWNDYDKE